VRIALVTSSDGWHVSDLVRAAKSQAVTVEPLSFRRLQGWVCDGASRFIAAPPGRESNASATFDLRSVERVLVRTMPAGSLEQIVFRMDVLHRIEAAGIAVLNPPRGLEAAIDKYLATARLEAAGLPVPATAVCESADDACAAFATLGGDVVVKPLFGSEGQGIQRVTDPDLAYRVFRTLERLGAVLYLQQFVPHEGCDLRAFVLGDRVLTAMRRRHESDWRTNVARGAQGEAVELDAATCALAVRAAAAAGTVIAGVDLLPGRDGRLYVLEVNGVPGWRALSRVTGVDVAAAVLRFVVHWPNPAENQAASQHQTNQPRDQRSGTPYASGSTSDYMPAKPSD
jgi:ribosomal protein S6--L-glutamate ligase